MTVPSEVLGAISSAEGGKVVIVVGAGCSVEAPTDLPLAGSMSEDAHRKLVADGVLEDGDCPEPWDLSALADIVKSKRNGKQKDLVQRLPVAEFKNATPNRGHKIAAALMVEGAISNIVTLNFDLALSHALSELGVTNEVSIILRPEQHSHLSTSNIIYLHRSIDDDEEKLVLTTESLDTEWQDAWEEVMARSALTAPVTIFAGLGSSCGVLRHSAEKLKSALGENTNLYLVSPGSPSTSKFASEMEIADENCIKIGWCEFMEKLGARLHIEAIEKIRLEAESLSQREGWIDPNSNKSSDDISSLLNQFAELSLLVCGEIRSAWLLDDRAYLKLETSHIVSIADLLLCIAYLEKVSNGSAKINSDGKVVLTPDGKAAVSLRLIDGSSRNYRWSSLEAELRARDSHVQIGTSGELRQNILACNVSGRKPNELATPSSIINGEDDDENIIGGHVQYSFWNIDDFRNDPIAYGELVS